MVRLRLPVATYRLQFNRGFRLEDARALVPYLHRLGVSDLYASPILRARKGSSHGYDVTDPTGLNPELGTEQDFEALVRELKAHGMGLLLDIVPNHMAASPENPWWMDLLENGPSSPYAAFFDIDWNPPGSTSENKVLLPILSSPYSQALENQELVLTLKKDGLFIKYRGLRLPLDIKSYGQVLCQNLDSLKAALGVGDPAFPQLKRLIEAVERLPCHTDTEPEKITKRQQENRSIKKELWRLVKASPEVRVFLLKNIALVNGKKGDPKSFALLDRLLEQQAYRLAFWKTAREEINYRRFFDISDLIGVRVEDSRAFEATHTLVLRFVREGKVTGLRIDHIDGLYDPLQYLRQLQYHLAPEAQQTGTLPGFYVIVEKILAGEEALHPEWPVHGTTGYDFLNRVNALFVDEKGFQEMKAHYAQITRSKLAFRNVVYQKKRQVIEELFASEIHRLGHQLACLAQQDRYARNLSPEELTKGLKEVTACLPVYRTYTRTIEVSPLDQHYIERAIEEAQRQASAMQPRLLDFLKRVLFLDFPVSLAPDQKEAWLRFVMRWQQFTGTIMAKGLEDTALYAYNPLISLNEVGRDIGAGDMPIEAFHRGNMIRQARWPYTLNATSTHDTKRSEDVRARLNVVSEMPEAWEKRLTQWRRWNRAKKQRLGGQLVPDSNMEVHLYQTLIGAWPLSEKEIPGFKERLKAYVIKADREAKDFSSWLSPDLAYEDALLAFVDSILKNSDQSKFLQDFLLFQRRVAYYGALNGLSQVLLKIVSPGIPDLYQGAELWDLSLVDPDNRRPVDFGKRMSFLDDLIRREAQGRASLLRELLSSWEDGRVKLYVIYKALSVRRVHQDLFLKGRYIPLQVRGQRQDHVCAFVRRHGKRWVLVAIPRLLTRLVEVDTLPLGQRAWRQDALLLPQNAPEHWLHVFTGETVNISPAAKEMPLSSVFSTFPVALLVSPLQEWRQVY
jgi:(1->4)-alpha-D-glucan 1-alpha-D-glucosylmutase